MKFSLNCPEDWEEFSKYLATCDENGQYIVEIKRVGKRTLPQNSAIHLYCEMMAEALNHAGFEYTEFVELISKKGASVPWSQEKFKDMWKIVQMAMIGHDKTSKLDKDQVSKVYEVVNGKFAEIAGVSMNFPDKRG